MRTILALLAVSLLVVSNASSARATTYAEAEAARVDALAMADEANVAWAAKNNAKHNAETARNAAQMAYMMYQMQHGQNAEIETALTNAAIFFEGGDTVEQAGLTEAMDGMTEYSAGNGYLMMEDYAAAKNRYEEAYLSYAAAKQYYGEFAVAEYEDADNAYDYAYWLTQQ